MAEVEVAIRRRLLDTPAIASLVGDRIYPEIMPEGAPYPAITYGVTEDPDMVLSGPTGIVEATVELVVWARATSSRSGYATVRELAGEVRRALLGAPGVIEGVDLMTIAGGTIDIGAPDTTTGIWQAWIDVHVIARPV